MHPAGLRLRQTREALGLTYRDVERASYQIAVNRGRPDFILHISRLADMQPHTLSRCAPESWLMPDEAEVVGQVVGVVSYLGDPWTYRLGAVPEARSDWNSKAL